MGSSCAHYQNKLETKKQYLTTLLERIHGENPKKTKKHRQNQKNLEKTKKTKNQNFSENVWSEAHVWLFLVLPSFFVFLVLTLKKLKKLNVFWFFG